MLRGLQTLNNDNCDSVCDPLPQNYTNNLDGCCTHYGCDVDHENNSCRSKNITPPSPDPSQPSYPDGCPSAYFDNNGIANFKGSCDNNSTGGYNTCCRCGGMSGEIHQCPPGCIDDSDGNCIPDGNKPPSPSLPTKRGCYSKDEEGNYYKMDVKIPAKCKSPNFWVDGNGGSPPQPNQPQPSKNKCDDYQYMSPESGKCVTITKDSKWTKDFYNFFLNKLSKNIPKNYVICVVSNMTTQFTPYEVINADKDKDVQQQLEDLMKKCRSGDINAITPKLYSANSGPGPGPGKNKTTDYVFIGLIGLCILIFAGMLLSNSVRQNKTRLTLVGLTIAILIIVFVVLLYTTIHKK